MRFYKKYKNHYKITNFLTKFPIARLIKFKRPKWKKLQLIFNKKFTLNQQIFSNNLGLKVNYKHWDKLKTSYKDGLNIKTSILALYDNAISVKFFNKEFFNRHRCLGKNLLISSLIKPLYRIDILLWKLNFFTSVFHAMQEINNNQILVNNISVGSNYFVKKGDIITLPTCLKDFNFSNLTEFLHVFIEVDYYSNTLVVLKDISSLSSEDFNVLIKEAVSIKKFIDYIKMK